MIGVILAAGIGKRLMPTTRHVPKTLVLVRGKPILEYIVANLTDSGIKRIVVVVGHGKDSVAREMQRLSKEYAFEHFLIENVHFRKTNTGYSLLTFLKSGNSSEDAIVVNGDLVFDSGIAMRIVTSEHSGIVVDRTKRLTDESFKVKIVRGSIASMGKQLPIGESSGEFIGISKIKDRNLQFFTSVLEKLVAQDENVYYDLAFVEMGKTEFVDILYTDGLEWTEVDTIDDLGRAVELAKTL